MARFQLSWNDGEQLTQVTFTKLVSKLAEPTGNNQGIKLRELTELNQAHLFLAVPTHLRTAPELKDRQRPTNPLAPPALLRQRPQVVVTAMGRRLTARLEGGLKAAPPVTLLNC